MTTVIMDDKGVYEIKTKDNKRNSQLSKKITNLKKKVSGINAIIQELHIEMFKIQRGISNE